MVFATTMSGCPDDVASGKGGRRTASEQHACHKRDAVRLRKKQHPDKRHRGQAVVEGMQSQLRPVIAGRGRGRNEVGGRVSLGGNEIML